MRRILRASDFSPASVPAFAEAIALAKKERAATYERLRGPAARGPDGHEGRRDGRVEFMSEERAR